MGDPVSLDMKESWREPSSRGLEAFGTWRLEALRPHHNVRGALQLKTCSGWGCKELRSQEINVGGGLSQPKKKGAKAGKMEALTSV